MPIKEDISLPSAPYIKIKDAINYLNKRIEVRGWIRRKLKPCKLKLRKANSRIMFIDLTDDPRYPSLQCVFEGDIRKSKEAMLLNDGSILTIRGVISLHTANQFELKADYFEFCDSSYFRIKAVSAELGWEARCEYAVYGYIRAEQMFFNLTSNNINQVVMLFFGDIWNDYWDLKSKNRHIQVVGNNIKTTAQYGTTTENSIFGRKVIYGFPKCESYKWKLQMIHSNEYGNRHCFFGIIPEKNVFDRMYDWFVSSVYGGYGYCHRNGLRYHNAVCDLGSSQEMSYGVPLEALDIIEIHLDLKQQTLRYCVNGTDLGVAYDNIPTNTNYRLAVTMGWDGEEIKLLKCI